MSKLDELRQHGGSFPGGLYNVLAEFDERLRALEGHKPMLDDMKPDYDEHMARQAARQQTEAEQPEQQSPATPAPATPAPATPAPATPAPATPAPATPAPNPQGATS